jgi:bacillithiol system protein YtxJ
MLKWLSRGSKESKEPKPAAAAVQPGESAKPQKLPLDLARIAEQDLVVVFKHSTTCPISYVADRQMRAFQASHPEVPVFKVLVREQRDLSRQIAEWTGVIHQSPQVIVLRRGAVAGEASQGDVTEEYLEEAIESRS